MAQVTPYNTYLTSNGKLDTDTPPGPFHCVGQNVTMCQSFNNGAGNCGGGADNCIESYIQNTTANGLSTEFTLSVQLDSAQFSSYQNLAFTWSYYRHFFCRTSPPTGSTPIPQLSSAVGDQKFDEGAFIVSTGFPEFDLVSHQGTVSAPNGILTASLLVTYNSPITEDMYWDFQFHTVSLRVTPEGSAPPPLPPVITTTNSVGQTITTTSSTSTGTGIGIGDTGNGNISDGKSGNSNNTGIIVGGILGGLAIIAIAAVAFWWIARRTRRRRDDVAEPKPGIAYSPVPAQQQHHPTTPPFSNITPYQLSPQIQPTPSTTYVPTSALRSSKTGATPPWAGGGVPTDTTYTHSQPATTSFTGSSTNLTQQQPQTMLAPGQGGGHMHGLSSSGHAEVMPYQSQHIGSGTSSSGDPYSDLPPSYSPPPQDQLQAMGRGGGVSGGGRPPGKR